MREGVARGLVELRFRHRVDALSVTGGAVDGVSGAVLAPSDAAARRRPSSRDVVGDFALSAPAVIVTSGGIGGNHDARAPELARAPRPATRRG